MDDIERWQAFGSYIRTIRKEKNITMYAIEKEFGFSRQYWSRIELSKQGYALKPDLIQRIASILDINYIDLYEIVGYCDDSYIKEYYERKDVSKNLTDTLD